MEEFKACWTLSDANNDGVLDCDEFKVFAEKYNEKMARRWGECKKGSEDEDEMWYMAYNSINKAQ